MTTFSRTVPHVLAIRTDADAETFARETTDEISQLLAETLREHKPFGRSSSSSSI